MDKTERKKSLAVGHRLIRAVFAAAFCFLMLASCSLPRIIILDDPLTPEEHLNLGVAYEKKAEYGPAIDEYKKASEKIDRAYVHLGNVYFQKGDYREAEEAYREAIERDKSLSDAYNNLAWLYYTKKENLAEAESLVSKAIELDPKNVTYRDTLDRIREVNRAGK